MSKKRKNSPKRARASARRAEKRAERGRRTRGHRPRPGADTAGEASDESVTSEAGAQHQRPELPELPTRGLGADTLEELAARAPDYADSDEMREQLRQLSTQEAAMFVLLMEKQLKRRRVQLVGYILAFVGFLVGMFVALYLYANREPGEFAGWAFFIPFVIVAAIFLYFGRLSKRG